MKVRMECKIAALAALLGGFCLYAQDPAVPDHVAAAQAIDQAKKDPDTARKEYADKVRETYNFRFGTDKWTLPGNVSVEGNDFVQAGAFPTVKYCAHCHEQAYSQWRQALHSNSFRTPFYRTSVNILLRTKGIEFARHCDSCHNPIAVLAGGMTQNSQVNRHFDMDGLTCTTCHSIQKLKSTEGNGGFVMGIPAVMVDASGNRIPGQVPYDQIMNHPELHAKAVMKDFYRTPEFCASCHKANLPNPLNDYKFVRAFTAYDEWQNSKFSQRNPLTFYTADFTTCQGCHMKRAPLPENVVDYGAKHGTFASHRWPAGNTAVPFYYGFDEQLQKTIDFLKSGDYLNVDLFAIKKGNSAGMIAPLGSTPFHLAANDIVQTMVVIQNKNIGHSLIPEVRDLYEGWVEFIAKQADGTEIYHSGFIKPDGMLDERAHSFTNRPVNMNGDFVDNHMVWTIHSVAYDNTIQAGRSALVRYEFRIPPTAKGLITITARVNYRHLRESYLNNVLGTNHPPYPIVELASRTRTLALGENPVAAPDPRDNPDWMRWNNLGIAYLDQFQYAEAMQAFGEVVKLRPDYAEGYTNIGLTNILWEKYASARNGLEKSLALNPDNARALFYLALVERRSGNTQTEITDLEKVVAKFPQSRDVRREMGSTYYREHRYPEARAQFEALQAIDPDDVAAHYNLAILYRRLGMPEKAAEQAAQFATKKTDPGAPTYSSDFLRRHPEISEESIPWHVHTDLKPETTSINVPVASASGIGSGGPGAP
jgi:tetratricopeptide (TPR) repeat protein